ncbi:BolA family protein [Aspergillus clavatus NRRL 1]|uniref:BolA domain protein n=1 Tax=Aspergillus clavatus (strain ATCC 1007 / CBS 513.65 / DSM 816 / NCTC 3887 / NRRL 1 / QM 1276 / 107) TaxID=344612 RepID=A1CG89_ASPCL|nr:BolA domain protein [Aspergillus clavatus NRRL 1]EAW10969.1 BolA domain protein [Aspergillus clavatus NRRL 1]
MLLLRSRPGLLPRRLPAISSIRMASSSMTPVEDTIREKVTAAFSPTTLIIRNDSHKHAHHAPMQGVASKETHFHVTITSSTFQSKMQPARHRMVYGLLKEEMSREGGIHALQLKTKTPEEEQREKERAQAPASA